MKIKSENLENAENLGKTALVTGPTTREFILDISRLYVVVPGAYCMGQCQSWTLDCGLDYGLRFGLNFGLNFGLFFS